MYHHIQGVAASRACMHLAELPRDQELVRRYARELWLPYHRDLEAAVATHALADEIELEAEVDFRLDQMDDEEYRVWVAVENGEGLDGEWIGFVTTTVDACPDVFDRPDRLVIGDIWVEESHRGTGVADRFVQRARQDGRERGCAELRLDVDVENERAIAFYEKQGFTPHRYQMTAPIED